METGFTAPGPAAALGHWQHIEAQRICVFRALQLGDMICAGPALRALRRRFPAACIVLVGLPWAADFAARMKPFVDEYIEFPGWPGLPERPVDHGALPGFLADLGQRRFDLAVQLHGSGRLTNDLVRGFGARRMAAHTPGPASHAAAGEGRWPYPAHLHEVHRNLHLIGRLGGAMQDDRLTFPLTPGDRMELRQRRPDLHDLPQGRYVCLHPGARDAAKRWPPASFAAVGDALAAHGVQVVVTGNQAERSLADEVVGRMQAPAVHAACDIPIGALAHLLSQARLLVSNDTGVAHVAAALGLPSVVMFFATDPHRWAPLDRRRHVVVHTPVPAPPGRVVAAALGLCTQAP
jgi:hypothetical protein